MLIDILQAIPTWHLVRLFFAGIIAFIGTLVGGLGPILNPFYMNVSGLVMITENINLLL